MEGRQAGSRSGKVALAREEVDPPRARAGDENSFFLFTHPGPQPCLRSPPHFCKCALPAADRALRGSLSGAGTTGTFPSRRGGRPATRAITVTSHLPLPGAGRTPRAAAPPPSPPETVTREPRPLHQGCPGPAAPRSPWGKVGAQLVSFN